jgi:WhiB family redox-sensing transcriptional regulator
VNDIVRLLHLPADWTWPGSTTETSTVPAWQRSANCLGVDPDLFFPERGGSTREAKEVCRGCVVRQECLQYALDNGEKFGIWGGLSERERRRLRRRRDGTPYRVSQAS